MLYIGYNNITVEATAVSDLLTPDLGGSLDFATVGSLGARQVIN